MLLKEYWGRKLIITVIVFLTLAALLFWFAGRLPDLSEASGGKDAAESVRQEKKVRLRFMNWDSSDKVTREKLEKALKEFGERFPHIEVVSISVPFYEYQEQLIRQTSNGTDPDIIQLTGYWPTLLGNIGALEPLDNYCGEDRLLDFYSGEGVQTCKIKGVLYSLPFSFNPYGLWYNKNLLKNAGIQYPPKTIEELDVQLDILKRQFPDAYGIGLDLTRTEHALTTNWPIFFSFGATNLLVDIRNPGFSSKEAMRAVEWIKRIAKARLTPDGVKTDILREKMANGQIAFKIDGPELRGVIQGKSKSADYQENLFDRAFGVVPVPMASGYKSVALASTCSFGISSRSKYKREAWELVKFIAREGSASKSYVIPSGYIPSLRSAIDNNAVELNNPSTHIFLSEIIPVSKSIHYSPRFSESSMIIIDGMRRIFAGADTESVCKEMDLQLRQLLNE